MFADATEDTGRNGIQHFESSGWYLDDIYVKRGTITQNIRVRRLERRGCR
jgi:hypothetical protein